MNLDTDTAKACELLRGKIKESKTNRAWWLERIQDKKNMILIIDELIKEEAELIKNLTTTNGDATAIQKHRKAYLFHRDRDRPAREKELKAMEAQIEQLNGVITSAQKKLEEIQSPK